MTQRDGDKHRKLENSGPRFRGSGEEMATLWGCTWNKVAKGSRRQRNLCKTLRDKV